MGIASVIDESPTELSVTNEQESHQYVKMTVKLMNSMSFYWP